MENIQPDSSEHRRVALIIGNGNYSRPENILSQSIKNAENLSELLTQVNFIMTKHTDILTDVMESIREFEETIQAGDLLFFYYSGHGFHVNGVNYLIPIDDSEIVSPVDVETFGVDVDHVIRRLVEEKQLYASIMVFDCCRPYLSTRASTSDTSLPEQGFGQITQAKRAFIQLPCSTNEVVHSQLFSQSLLENILEENVEISEVFRRITENVYQKSNHKEQPFSLNNLSGPIYLNEVRRKIPNHWEVNGCTIAGGYGTGRSLDSLCCPKGLYVTDKQTVFVADDSNHRAMKFKQDAGTGRRLAGQNNNGYGPDRLSGPSDILYDKVTHSFIIADRHNRRVLQWFSGKKTFEKILIENIQCYGLAMDDEGFLYVSDTEQHEVKRYSLEDISNGTLVAGGNGQGRRLHQLNHPTYICIGLDQSLYVSDTWNNRVMRWDRGAKQGDVVAGGKGKGSSRTQLDCPTGVCVDEEGTVYVADRWNNRVMRWSADKTSGEVIAGGLRPGHHPSQLNSPEGLAFDRQYNLYVVDSGNHRVQRFDAKDS